MQGPSQPVVETLEASFGRITHVKTGIGHWPLGPMGTEACACRCAVVAGRLLGRRISAEQGEIHGHHCGTPDWAVSTVLHLNHGHLWGQG